MQALGEAIGGGNLEEIYAAIQECEWKNIPERSLTNAREKAKVIAMLTKPLVKATEKRDKQELDKNIEVAEKADCDENLGRVYENAVAVRNELAELHLSDQEKAKKNAAIEALTMIAAKGSPQEIQKAIDLCISRKAPESSVRKAREKVLFLTNITAGLDTSIKTRNMAELDKHIAMAEKKDCVLNLGILYTDAVRVRNEEEDKVQREQRKIIQDLTEALANGDVESVQSAIKRCENKKIPEINLTEARKKLVPLIRISGGLKAATQKRNKALLDMYIEMAEKEGCVDNMGTLYTDAFRVREEEEERLWRAKDKKEKALVTATQKRNKTKLNQYIEKAEKEGCAANLETVYTDSIKVRDDIDDDLKGEQEKSDNEFMAEQQKADQAAALEELKKSMETDDVETIQQKVRACMLDKGIPESSLQFAKDRIELIMTLKSSLEFSIKSKNIAKLQKNLEIVEKERCTDNLGQIYTSAAMVCEDEAEKLRTAKEKSEIDAAMKTLSEAMDNGNLITIQQAINLCTEKEISESILIKAREKRASLFKFHAALSAALRKKNKEELDKYIERANKEGYANNLGALYHNAVSARDAMVRVKLEKEKAERDAALQTLLETIYNGSVADIQQAIRECVRQDIPESNLRDAKKKVEALLKLYPELEAATLNRDKAELDRCIQAVDKAGCAQNLGSMYTKAVEVRDQLVLIAQIKSKMQVMDNDMIVTEMTSYPKPSEAIHVLIATTYMILGEEEEMLQDWNYVRILLSKSDHESLKVRAMDFAPEYLELSVARRAQVKLSQFTKERMTRNSAISGLLYNWCMSMIIVCEQLHAAGISPDTSSQARRKSNVGGSRRPSMDSMDSKIMDSRRKSIESYTLPAEALVAKRRASMEAAASFAWMKDSLLEGRRHSIDRRPSVDASTTSIENHTPSTSDWSKEQQRSSTKDESVIFEKTPSTNKGGPPSRKGSKS